MRTTHKLAMDHTQHGHSQNARTATWGLGETGVEAIGGPINVPGKSEPDVQKPALPEAGGVPGSVQIVSIGTGGWAVT